MCGLLCFSNEEQFQFVYIMYFDSLFGYASHFPFLQYTAYFLSLCLSSFTPTLNEAY